jgi:hypothetical protein
MWLSSRGSPVGTVIRLVDQAPPPPADGSAAIHGLVAVGDCGVLDRGHFTLGHRCRIASKMSPPLFIIPRGPIVELVTIIPFTLIVPRT